LGGYVEEDPYSLFVNAKLLSKTEEGKLFGTISNIFSIISGKR
jgi:hypothetical protein